MLEELLELQELLAEFQMAEADERSALQPALQEKRATLQAEQDRAAAELTGPLSTQWDALQPGAHSPEERERLLDRLRDGLNARAYLRRALDTLRAALPSS